MTREEAKKMLPIIQAWAEGKTVEMLYKDNIWIKVDNPDFTFSAENYRIKIESKYRPFKNQEECWQEMLKHQPFGWVRSTVSDNLYPIESISDEINYNKTFASYNEAFEWVKFADGRPFGVMEE